MPKKLPFILAGLVGGLFVLASCTGPAGATGVAGAQGLPGPAGLAGPQGTAGTQGAPGEAIFLQEVGFGVGQRAGGPVKVTASGSDTRWILPGLRGLDPAIFGTPENPLAYDGAGLPLGARLTTEDGKAYTTTAMPTPFSDKFMPSEGGFSLEAWDATLVDGTSTKDRVDFSASFAGPDGKDYTLTVKKVIPMGPDHPFFGGVATDIIHHGNTGIGTKLMPQAYTYVAFWGIGELSINGQVVASNRLVHAMLTSSVRDKDYKVVFNGGVDNSHIQFHLIAPPVEITSEGPKASPVPTGFVLPNGAEQPFLHIMYEDVSIGSALIIK